MMSDLFGENFMFMWQNVWTSGAMFALFAVSFIFLAVRHNKNIKSLFWYSAAVMALVIFNPLFWFKFVSIFYTDPYNSTYYLTQIREYWLLPGYLIMAHFLSCIVCFWKKRWIRVILAISGCAFIWEAGVTFPSIFVQRANKYKISDEALLAADMILEDIENFPEGLEERPAVFEVYDTELSVWDDLSQSNFFHFGIRQYTSQITLSPVQILPDTYNADGFNISSYYTEPYSYLICPSADVLVKEVERVGYEGIGTTENYAIFRYRRDETIYLVCRGQTLADISGTIEGVNGDATLTEEGYLSIQSTASELESIPFYCSYASEAGQALQTAEYILQKNVYWTDSNTVVASAALNDISWGSAEGQTSDYVLQTYGENALELGEATDSEFVSLVGAETKYSAIKRFRSGMAATVKNMTLDSQNILVVANPSIIWWVRYVTGRDDVPDLEYGECLKLCFTDGSWSLEEDVG